MKMKIISVKKEEDKDSDTKVGIKLEIKKELPELQNDIKSSSSNENNVDDNTKPIIKLRMKEEADAEVKKETDGSGNSVIKQEPSEVGAINVLIVDFLSTCQARACGHHISF